MSATGRGAKRRDHDFYATPAWCVHRLLEAIDLPPGILLEPCVGDGAIVRAFESAGYSRAWDTMDVREESIATTLCDFLLEPPSDPGWYSCVITNPPYSQAMEFIQHSMKFAPVVIMLLRLNFLGGGKRAAWLREYPPDVYVLPNRPSFTGGGTDACEYAWFVWGLTQGGHLQVLAETPREVRRAA